MLDAFGRELWVVKGGAVDDRVWVKHYEVGFEPRPNQTAVV